MSTRGMVAIQRYTNSLYELYYQHCDAYPTWLGVKLIELMEQNLPLDEIIAELGLEDEHRSVSRPEDAFLKVQGDLEWIYVIRENSKPELRSLSIIKTSSPHSKIDFTFHAWFSYVKYFPENYEEVMDQVQRIASIALRCLAAFEEAAYTKRC